MSEFATDQAHLDADVAAETDALAGLEAWIADLKQAHSSSIDFTAADAFVARLKGDEPPADPAPVVDAPVDAPSDTPVADETTTATGVDPNAA